MNNIQIMEEERGKLWRTFKKNKTALVGTVIIIIVIAVAILAPWISPHDPLWVPTNMEGMYCPAFCGAPAFR
ncbi:MAG: hypothetical protein NTY86_08275 [Deltaproteobacteria bacterium]|nr:hypothetical protein [Deltaproteobacteria bacterium]